jgi:hypothetical protein
VLLVVVVGNGNCPCRELVDAPDTPGLVLGGTDAAPATEKPAININTA